MLSLKLEQMVASFCGLRIVNRGSRAYKDLVISLRDKGMKNPITVRLAKDAWNKDKLYEVVDGNHRLVAMKDAGYDEAKVNIVSLDDTEFFCAQIILNKDATIDADMMAQHLRRILAREPLLTAAQLADMVQWDVHTVFMELLNKVNDRVYNLVKAGKINCVNAYSLQKLPKYEQDDWIDRAMTMRPMDFVPTIAYRIRKLRDEQGFYNEKLGEPFEVRERRLIEEKRRMEQDEVYERRKQERAAARKLILEQEAYAEAFRLRNLETCSARELLHGKPKKQEPSFNEQLAATVKEFTDTLDDGIMRLGWDKVHQGKSEAYCRGDVLVANTGLHWIICHPKITKLTNLNFSDALEAMKFVEEHVKC